MGKKYINTSIDEDVLSKFRKECDKEGYKMNQLLEMFMRGFINKEFVIKIEQK